MRIRMLCAWDVRGVKTAGNVGMVNQRKQLQVWSADPIPVSLSQVDVDQCFVLDWAHGDEFVSLLNRYKCGGY